MIAGSCWAFVGCSDAPNTVQGGDPLFDASPMPVSEGGGFNGPSGCQAGGANAGSTWADLYTCFFGPSGVASCGMSGCHGPGSAGSGIWTCGPTSQECWQGIQMVIGSTDPMATQLYSGLRKPDGSGLNNMPLTGPGGAAPYVFTNDDLQRVRMWIQDGAKGP
jgi:hypothetical protein